MPSTGLALGYFFNFVKPVALALDAATLRDNRGTVRLTVSKDAALVVVPGVATLNIFLPRDLPDSCGDLHAEIGSLGCVAHGSVPMTTGSRDLPLSFWEPKAVEGPVSQTAGLFDIPTALGACYKRRQPLDPFGDLDEDSVTAVTRVRDHRPASSNGAGSSSFKSEEPVHGSVLKQGARRVSVVLQHASALASSVLQQWSNGLHCVQEHFASKHDLRRAVDEGVAGEQVDTDRVPLALELVDFANALHGLISRDPVAARRVRVWSVPPPPFDATVLTRLCQVPVQAATLARDSSVKTVVPAHPAADGSGPYHMLDA
jgi:hypothetical protein